MWSGGDDWSDQGEQVRLYIPTLYGKNKPLDPQTSSFIGGSSPSLDDKDESPCCPSCQEQMYLLVHLIAPKRNEVNVDRCVEVLACNRASCMTSMFQENSLCYGGAGTVVCRRGNLTSDDSSNVKKPVSRDVEVSGASSKCGDDTDWAVTPDDADTDIDDLEAKLAAMEAVQSNKKKPVKKEKTQATTLAADESKDRSTTLQFPSFPLSSLLEPPSDRLGGAADEDDVGMSTGTDDKIQAMLAKYMAEEEDEGILSALRGVGGDGGSGGGKERDERLSASERALLSYSDRLKRSPRQVLRYAYGGVPMWSIPVSTPEQQGKQKNKSKIATKKGTLQDVPPCSCGAPREFEFQLLPSLLHVLEVDKHAESNSKATEPLTSLEAAYAQSGMNYGNVAVYTCSKACGSSNEEYVVVQDSVDEVPLQRIPMAGNDEPVVIAEGTQFGHVDDDMSVAMDGEDDGSDDEEDYDEAFEELDENDKRI